MYCSPVKYPIARKPHNCQSCGDQIAKGEKYAAWRCICDDSVSTIKMHIECFQMHDDESDGYWDFDLFGHDRPNPESEKHGNDREP